MNTSQLTTGDRDSELMSPPAQIIRTGRERTGREGFIGWGTVVCAVIVIGVVSSLLIAQHDNRPAPFPLLTGEPGPLPYDQASEPRVFVGSH